MMDRLTRILTILVRGLAGLLGAERRDWVDALLAEVGQYPSRSARLAWVSGGLWLVTKELVLNRIIRILAFTAGAVALVRAGWPGAATNSAIPVNRMYVVGTLVLLAGLPLLVRRRFGMAQPGWAPRTARVGGYAVVITLIGAIAVKDRLASELGQFFPVIVPVWVMDVGFLLVLAAYIAGLLILTSQQVRFSRRVLPLSVGIGICTAAGLYALAPFGIDDLLEAIAHTFHGGPAVGRWPVLLCFGFAALAVPVAVHAMATRLADRDNRPGVLSPAQQALLATSAAMATAALLVAMLTSVTIALMPSHVPQQFSTGGMCPTCDPSTIVIPTNLRHEYYEEESIDGAGGDTLTALLIVPLLGAGLGAMRGQLRTAADAVRPAHLTEGA